jgi:hypothetical protein
LYGEFLTGAVKYRSYGSETGSQNGIVTDPLLEEKAMRPLGLDATEQLRLAREYAVELERDWRAANARTGAGGRRSAGTALAALVKGARSFAGRGLVGLGNRLATTTGGAEPCS